MQPVSLGDARMEQLQQSVDAIAVEVERIGEAQRFNAKLAAQRGEGTVEPRHASYPFVERDGTE